MNFMEILSEAVPVIQKIAPILASKLSAPESNTLLIVSILFALFDSPTKDGKFDFSQLAKNIISDPNVQSKLLSIEAAYK